MPAERVISMRKEFTECKYENGDSYKGETIDTKRSGRGEYIWSNGQKYIGDFFDDKINGSGTLYYTNGNTYKGQWKDELQDGRGELRIAGTEPKGVEFDNGKYDLTERINGFWVKGKLEGAAYRWIAGIPYMHWFEHDIDKGDYLDLAPAEREVTDTSMRGKFLGQSGFWIQLPEATLLFDCYIGKLPPTRKDKPLIVFISHLHNDHFNRYIFHLMEAFENISFVVGLDQASEALFKNMAGHLEKELPGLDDRCFTIKAGETLDFGSIGVKVEALRSTDMGTAFIVTAGDKTIYHAGDLWIQPLHIEGPDGKAPSPEVLKEIKSSPEYSQAVQASEDMFRKFIAPLKGRHIDFAMLPLDPRFGTNGEDSMEIYLETADIDTFIPMHLWENYGYLDSYIKKHPDSAKKMIKPVLNGRNSPSTGILRSTDGVGYFKL